MNAASEAIGRRSGRKRSRWRSPISADTVSTLIVIGVMLLMPLLAIETVGWAVDMNTILPVTFLAVFVGLFLARSRFGEIVALSLSFIFAIGLLVAVAAYNMDLPFREAVSSVFERCYEWIVDLVSGDTNNTDELVQTLLVGFLFWFLAYNANWHVFRLDRVWRVLLPPGLVLLVNMIFVNRQEPVDRYLFGFALMALALLIRSHLNARRWDWQALGIRVPTMVRRQFALVGILLSLLALFLAWNVPSQDLQDRLERFQQFLASDPIEQIAEAWSRVFAPIEGDGPATTDYYGADLLRLGGAITLGDDIIFTVEAPRGRQRYYWRSRVYERYINGQWSPSADLRITDRSPPLDVRMSAEVIGARREPLRQRFTVGTANARIFYAAPQPRAVDRSGRIDLIFTDKPENNSMNLSVVRPLKVMKRGESYTVDSLLSVASADELRGASRDYPEWVSGANLYIGLPSAPILQLTQQIIDDAGAVNPYDQAKAIERWLRRNIAYNESISAPPPNVDTVEWVLFDVREGYCTYYATAMIVMLRHLGIPARLAAGFSQGEFDAGLGQFVVREREAHTWVEVYFPGYGWIEFEPTAAQAPIHRDGDELAEEDEAPLRPEPTTTPTPTALPTPQPSPTAEPEQDARQQDLERPTETPTPTAIPSPSPTPFILPTVEPPISPDNPPPLSLLQPLILFVLALMLFLLILAIIGLLLFWWWEWRGMSGLSPVTRAYARLERYIQLLGINIGRSQTTLERRRELQQRLPAARDSIRTISDLYTRERYDDRDRNSSANQTYAETADKAWFRARGNILRRWLRRRIPFLRRR